jgi:hydrogenase-4 component E
MNGINDALWLLVLVTLIMLSASSRLLRCIRNVAFQGLLVGIIPLALHGFSHIAPSHLALSAVNIILKSVLLPALMIWTVKRIGIKRELEPLLGYGQSIAVTLTFILLSFVLSARLPLPEGAPTLALPAAFSAMLTGHKLINAKAGSLRNVLCRNSSSAYFMLTEYSAICYTELCHQLFFHIVRNYRNFHRSTLHINSNHFT